MFVFSYENISHYYNMFTIVFFFYFYISRIEILKVKYSKLVFIYYFTKYCDIKEANLQLGLFIILSVSNEDFNTRNKYYTVSY